MSDGGCGGGNVNVPAGNVLLKCRRLLCRWREQGVLTSRLIWFAHFLIVMLIVFERLKSECCVFTVAF